MAKRRKIRKRRKPRKRRKRKKAKNEQEEPEEPPEGTPEQSKKEVDPLTEPRKQSKRAHGQILEVETLLNKLKGKKVHLGHVGQALDILTTKKVG